MTEILESIVISPDDSFWEEVPSVLSSSYVDENATLAFNLKDSDIEKKHKNSDKDGVDILCEILTKKGILTHA